jgi:hypothetical protein
LKTSGYVRHLQSVDYLGACCKQKEILRNASHCQLSGAQAGLREVSSGLGRMQGELDYFASQAGVVGFLCEGGFRPSQHLEIVQFFRTPESHEALLLLMSPHSLPPERLRLVPSCVYCELVKD